MKYIQILDAKLHLNNSFELVYNANFIILNNKLVIFFYR